MTKYYSIGEVAKLLDIPSSTLRYYDKQGILLHLKRNEAGIRQFDETDIDMLRHLHLFKIAGMPLKTIRHYFELFAQGDSSIAVCYELIKHQEEKTRQAIEEMKKSLQILEVKRKHYQALLDKTDWVLSN